MWISKICLDWLDVSKDSIDQLRVDNATLRTKSDALQAELTRAHITQDWLRQQVNQLQMERAGLMEKAHGITVPAPQFERAKTPAELFQLPKALFDHIPDEDVQKLGLN
jgi:hypothetical protein